MKKILYSLLTIVLGLVLSSSGCSTTVDPFDPGIYDEGVTINGVTWATRNVDAVGKFAENAGSAGMFYQWNNKKAWPATGPITGTWPTTPASGSTWTSANDPCPDDWKVPTQTELEKLLAASVIKTFGTSHGKDGLWFGTASLPYQLFFPAYGERNSDGVLTTDNNYGGYWSSTQFNGSRAYSFDFYNPNFYADSEYAKICGLLIRCVKK